MQKVSLLVILGFLLIFAVVFQNKSSIKSSNPVNIEASLESNVKVTRVIDGDTVKVLIGNKEETVRLIGIDTPEILDPRKPIQCFAKEASDKAKSILTNQIVMLESDLTQGNRDKYRRLLRYVFLNHVNFNEFMISEGFAHEYTYRFLYKYQTEFKNAEKEARINKKGLWSDSSKCHY